MIDDRWYVSASSIAFYIGIVIVLLCVVVVHDARAQDVAPAQDGGGFWDVLGQWWDSLTDFLTGGKPAPMPIVVQPLMVGWSNKNHTVTDIVLTQENFTNESCYFAEPNATDNGGWHSCQDYRDVFTSTKREQIDERWQTVSNGVISEDLSTDYYWFVADGRIIGDSRRNCDGDLENKLAIEVKYPCMYITLNLTVGDGDVPVVLAEQQDAYAVRVGKPIETASAVDMAVMKVSS